MNIELKTWEDCQFLHSLIDEVSAEMENEFSCTIEGKKDFYEEVMRRYVTKTRVGDNYFEKLATQLRELWPSGNKDDKWPWRDSVKNLTVRLKTLWAIRKLKYYPIEDCLTVARRYLAKFENSTKYMKVLKYYILKQTKISLSDGHVNYVNESMFADMLEGKSEEDAVQNGWNSLLEEISIGEGVLI